MRLLNARTLQLEEFNTPRGIPDYAILSHTWGANEVNFEDMQNGGAQNKVGFRKIQFVCNQACLDGYEYAWVDTCCINKSSSAELSESINSMFEWYRKSKICYAYLEGISAEDVHDYRVPDDYHMLPRDEQAFRESKFGKHRWFQRGWTLQELIAPSRVEFYGKDWEYLGSSLDLLSGIVSITGIDDKVLGSDTTLKMKFLRRTTVAQRMSWAAFRSTTRLEDEAYCLLGLFGVNMPLLYGEGSTAFIRFQEEIIKSSTDQSIFAWHSIRESGSGNLLLAPSVSCFRKCGILRPLQEQTAQEPYSMTNAGLSIRLPFIDRVSGGIAILSCRYAGDILGSIGLCLQSTSDERAFYVTSITTAGRIIWYNSCNRDGRAVATSPDIIPEQPKMKALLLLRQPPVDFSLPLTQQGLDSFKKETETAFHIHKDFGSPRKSPLWMHLDFSIKALYPSMYWSRTQSEILVRDETDVLLLPTHISVGAIRIWYRGASFFITFGLEKRNWYKEALDGWINIHDSEGDLTIREVVRREEKLHRVDGFAVSKTGTTKATLTPKRFPDDCLEASISRKYSMGEEWFEIDSKAKKLTISTLVMMPDPLLQTHTQLQMIGWHLPLLSNLVPLLHS